MTGLLTALCWHFGFQQNRARLGSPWRAKIVSTRLTVAADYSWAS